MKRLNLLIVGLIVATFALQCTEQGTTTTAPTSTAPTSTTKNNGYVRVATPGFLPKYETLWERELRGKTDAYSDARTANSEKYYITKPPIDTEVRFPGEFEPMAYLLVGWQVGTGLDDFFIDIIKGAWGTTTVLLMNEGDVKLGTTTKTAKAWMIQYLKAKDPQTFDDQSLADTSKIRWIDLAQLNSVPVNAPADLRGSLNSIWARDYGPQPVIHKSGKVSVVETNYYYYRILDDKVPTEVANYLGINVFRASINQEGGNFQSDGEGNCFTSHGSLWFNLPDPDEAAQKKLYAEYFGCKALHFMMPLEGEGTTHIDMSMMVIGPNDIILGEYDVKPEFDSGGNCTNRAALMNKKVLDENAKLLEAIKDKDGNPKFRIHRVPMPPNGDLIWRTYTNFQTVRAPDGNTGVVLIPVYTTYNNKVNTALFKPYEDKMMEVYDAAFKQAHPGVTFKLIKINSDEIIPGNGAIHCVVHEIPKGVFEKEQTETPDLCGLKNATCQQTGCGSVTNAGYCDGNNAVYCYQNQVVYYPCGINCGEVQQGPCESTCGFLQTEGYYDCDASYVCGQNPSCTDDCQTGDKGCSDDGQKKWTCGENDNDACMDKVEESCGTGNACLNGECVPKGCTDECNFGDKGCDGNSVWTCERPQGELCFKKVSNDCGTGTCTNGACCQNECQLGEKGCTDGKNAWVCQAGRTGCLVKATQPCTGDATCQSGTCVTSCTDECTSGQTGCSDDGNSAWSCTKLPGGQCYTKVLTPCLTGNVCSSGICADPNGTPDVVGGNDATTGGDATGSSGKSGGCQVQTAAQPLPFALLVLLLLAAAILRRKRI
ncbi:MAG: agmatine deiminase family protein [Myxococcales bacterium]|nr:agmatine deiminase family protein [Myxococcales bacterium]